MRLISPDQIETVLTGYAISQDGDRHSLCPKSVLSELMQKRIGYNAERESNVEALAYALNSWLPDQASRLLWVDHMETTSMGLERLFDGVRGEGAPSVPEAPGHYFSRMLNDPGGLTDVPENLKDDVSALHALLVLMQLTASDGWLVLPGCPDRIEFWECHVFFHSASNKRLDEARTLMANLSVTAWA